MLIFEDYLCQIHVPNAPKDMNYEEKFKWMNDRYGELIVFEFQPKIVGELLRNGKGNYAFGIKIIRLASKLE